MTDDDPWANNEQRAQAFAALLPFKAHTCRTAAIGKSKIKYGVMIAWHDEQTDTGITAIFWDKHNFKAWIESGCNDELEIAKRMAKVFT